MTYELHPLCTLFPRLDADAFAALVEDIRANGLREPITLHDGMILDGGNRYRACLEAGVEPTFQNFAGGNVASYVLSANLHRRHLTAGQRASIVSSVADFAKAHPPHRLAASKKEEGNVPPLSTVAERAQASKVDRKTQKQADRVAKASPELSQKVAAGEIPLAKALEQVTGKKRSKPQPKSDGAPVETDADIIQNLRADLAVKDQIIAELSTELDAWRIAKDGEAAQKEIVVLNKKLATANQSRDQWMTTCGELRKEVAALRRQLKK